MFKNIASLVATSLLIVGSLYSQERPNVLFILIDDLGWKDLSYAGSDFYETPNIDAMANSGTIFNRANMAAPRCVSSRVALMTGRYPYRNKLKNKKGITRDTKLVSEVFKEEGYSTFFAGKWHLGHDASEYPDGRGFDINIGGCDYGSPKSYFFPFTKKAKPMPGLEEGVEGEELTARLTTETEKFIRDHVAKKNDQPFFAFLSHYGVHTPIEAIPEKVEKYKKKLAAMEAKLEGSEFFNDHTGKVKRHQNHPVYAAMIETVDESIGRLTALLKELKIDDNTLILFTSDHGGLSTTNAKGNRELATSNLPLRTGKGWLYEGGLRVPFIVVDPRHGGGHTTDAVINGTDIYPTLLDMAGLELRPEYHLDGESFFPAVKGQDYQRSKPIIYHYMFAKVGTGNTAMSVVLDNPYKLIYLEVEKQFQLYNLEKDAAETNNLSSSHPEVLARLDKTRLDWLKELKIRPLATSHKFHKTTLKLLKEAGLPQP